MPVSRVQDFSNRQDGGNYGAFIFAKRAFDIVFSLVLLPVLLACAVVLLILNPLMNKGSLLFMQIRMGKGCRAFTAIKFRSMAEADKITRGADDPLETHRINWFGHVLRRSRMDELPQLINVLKGEMSLIGPRPDFFHHARRYVQTVPGYRDRHTVRPGISGLGQTEVGYVEGFEATRAKVKADIYYINNACFRLDSWIFFRTLVTVFCCKGL
ncbi:MAG: sugar transferase [Rhodobacteraceae bacterium]|nr:sugar transferase [Paracoccaceae bacterium]